MVPPARRFCQFFRVFGCCGYKFRALRPLCAGPSRFSSLKSDLLSPDSKRILFAFRRFCITHVSQQACMLSERSNMSNFRHRSPGHGGRGGAARSWLSTSLSVIFGTWSSFVSETEQAAMIARTKSRKMVIEVIQDSAQRRLRLRLELMVRFVEKLELQRIIIWLGIDGCSETGQLS